MLLSVPHAGLRVPSEVAGLCILDAKDIAEDDDEQAAGIYAPLEEQVAAFVTTDIARAIVDMNRAPDDLRKDGVVKTHTCRDVPVYRKPLPDSAAHALIERYHRPWHERLSRLARPPIILGVDCHTMAAIAPPVAPDGYITRTHSTELPWVQLELSRAPFMSNAEKSRGVLKALRVWCDTMR